MKYRPRPAKDSDPVCFEGEDEAARAIAPAIGAKPPPPIYDPVRIEIARRMIPIDGAYAMDILRNADWVEHEMCPDGYEPSVEEGTERRKDHWLLAGLPNTRHWIRRRA